MAGIPSPVIYWIVNAIVLYIVTSLGGNAIVLGTFRFSPLVALLVTSFIITLFVYATKPFIEIAKNIIGFTSDNPQITLLVNLTLATLFNFAALWIMGRLAQYSGIGFYSYLWAFFLGLIVTNANWLVGRILEEYSS